MGNKQVRDFTIKFNELNEGNKKYIIAVQQALVFAQLSTGKAAKESKHERSA